MQSYEGAPSGAEPTWGATVAPSTGPGLRVNKLEIRVGCASLTRFDIQEAKAQTDRVTRLRCNHDMQIRDMALLHAVSCQPCNGGRGSASQVKRERAGRYQFVELAAMPQESGGAEMLQRIFGSGVAGGARAVGFGTARHSRSSSLRMLDRRPLYRRRSRHHRSIENRSSSANSATKASKANRGITWSVKEYNGSFRR
jgi:hypothetical protein